MNFDDQILERFIPVAYDELLEDALEHLSFEEEDIEGYRKFSLLLEQFYHAKFYGRLKRLKRLYHPFNPDTDTVTRQSYSPEAYLEMKSDLVKEIRPLLDNANYEELTEEELNIALSKTSPHGVEVTVDFDDFDDISLFYRGEAYKYEDKRDWKSFYLKKEQVRVNIYRRLFLLLKPKTLTQRAQEIATRDGQELEKVIKKLRKDNKVLIDGEKNERIFIKLFKDIPHPDLEMLFPNTKVRMTLQDKLKIGVTGGGGTVGGAITMIGKIGAVIEPFSLLMAIGGFGGVLWRQIKNVFTQHTRYMATLAKHLYYYNLDNNAGALAYMVNMAEMEESKEALLAYFFIVHDNGRLDRKALDEAIEAYMAATYELPMDFEVDDGVEKLLRLGLIEERETLLHAVAITEALSRLEQSWGEIIASGTTKKESKESVRSVLNWLKNSS